MQVIEDARCSSDANTFQAAEAILRLTKVGRNRIEIAGRKYYFVRSFTHFEDRGAVVFAPS